MLRELYYVPRTSLSAKALQLLLGDFGVLLSLWVDRIIDSDSVSTKVRKVATRNPGFRISISNSGHLRTHQRKPIRQAVQRLRHGGSLLHLVRAQKLGTVTFTLEDSKEQQKYSNVRQVEKMDPIFSRMMSYWPDAKTKTNPG